MGVNGIPEGLVPEIVGHEAKTSSWYLERGDAACARYASRKLKWKLRQVTTRSQRITTKEVFHGSEKGFG